MQRVGFDSITGGQSSGFGGRCMNRWLVIALIVMAPCVLTGNSGEMEMHVLCTDAWYRYIEENVPTGDGQGHGPDIGSDEWKSVIEFRLGIRGKPDLPARDGEAWCRAIDEIVRGRRTPSEDDSNDGETAMTSGPSYACDKVQAGSIEAMICEDDGLSMLDRKLADVYRAASLKAANEHPPVLKAEQRGWIKGRDDCWKSDDTRRCVEEEYQQGIAGLQARYHLVSGIGPVTYICDGRPGNEVVVTFFQTDPPTLIAEHGDSVSLMYLQPGGSGTRYQGRNETFWEHQGQASITWGYGAPAMQCQKSP